MEVIKFGRYPQKDNEVLPLEWYVVSDWAGKALLVSKHVIDCKAFHHRFVSEVSWKDCSLRKWLNLDFYLQAFSAEERKRIVPTPLYRDYYRDRYWRQSGVVRDKVFLLNASEIQEFLPMDIRKCTPTDFVRSKYSYLYNNSEYKDCEWWIRDSGLHANEVALCINDGTIDAKGCVNGWEMDIRPAIRIIPSFKINSRLPPLEMNLFTGCWSEACWNEYGELEDDEWNRRHDDWGDDYD